MTLPQVVAVCTELVDRRANLAGFFGGGCGGALVELRSVASINVQIFSDRLSRPHFAILSWLLKTSMYYVFNSLFCFFSRVYVSL